MQIISINYKLIYVGMNEVALHCINRENSITLAYPLHESHSFLNADLQILYAI